MICYENDRDLDLRFRSESRLHPSFSTSGLSQISACCLQASSTIGKIYYWTMDIDNTDTSPPQNCILDDHLVYELMKSPLTRTGLLWPGRHRNSIWATRGPRGVSKVGVETCRVHQALLRRRESASIGNSEPFVFISMFNQQYLFSTVCE